MEFENNFDIVTKLGPRKVINQEMINEYTL
jgi:hypothetical protein